MSLDQFVRCEVSGCEWHILLGYRRCWLHRGPAGPQYLLSADDGSIIKTKFMAREQDPGFEPLDAA